MKQSLHSPIVFILYLLSFIFFTPSNVSAQTCQDASVELSAVVQANPPRITLNWKPNAGATQYTVMRKLKTGLSCGSIIATLDGTATQYIDSTVSVGTSYEYRISR